MCIRDSLKGALRIRQTHGFSFWDSAILAAALAIGCDRVYTCLLYTSDAADERSSVDLGGRRIIKKKKKNEDRRRRRSI